jgi:hypothetical protein
MKQRAIFWLLLVFVVVVTAALFWLDFHAVRGETTADSQVETYSFSVDDETEYLREQSLDLYVVAPDRLEEELAAALQARLATTPYMNKINVHSGQRAPAPDSVLVLQVEAPDSFWSPVYGRSSLSVDLAYASDGAVDWIDDDVVQLQTTDPPTPIVRVRGVYDFSLTAYGLASLPGYHRYLADQVASHLSTSLADTLGNVRN